MNALGVQKRNRVIAMGSRELLNEVEMAFELGIERCPNGEGKKNPCQATHQEKTGRARLMREQPEQRHWGGKPVLSEMARGQRGN